MLLGIAHPDHAKRMLSYRQFLGWMAFLSVEPHGEGRADLRAGIVASTIAQAHAAKGKRFRPSDFMPDFEPRAKQMSATEMQAQMNLAIAADKRRK